MPHGNGGEYLAVHSEDAKKLAEGIAHAVIVPENGWRVKSVGRGTPICDPQGFGLLATGCESQNLAPQNFKTVFTQLRRI